MKTILTAIALLLSGCAYTGFNDPCIVWDRSLVPSAYYVEPVDEYVLSEKIKIPGRKKRNRCSY